MTLTVKKLRGKFRLMDGSRIARTHLGTPMDGGGGQDRQVRVRQALHVNAYLKEQNVAKDRK